jgi:hypothetical protein
VTATITEFLTRFFVEDLPFTPTARQIDLFQSDLALVSPYLMEAALKEVKAGTIGNALKYRPDEWRAQIFTVYNRKVAEHAQLFPIFHTFETAFRSTVAVILEDHYRCPDWWQGIYAQLRKGNAAANVTEISKVRISKDAAHLIGEIIYTIDGESLQRQTVRGFANGYQLLENCELVHTRQLVEEHWSVFGPRFRRGVTKLTVADFRNKFDRVRNARNDIYHHKSIPKLANVVAAAEDLLDYLNCAVGFVYAKIKDSKPVPPTFVVAIEPRHKTW